MSNYKGLALEGGGVAGIAHTGVLESLEKRGVVKNLTHFAGSSAGAIVAGALACKIPIDKIRDILFNTDFNTFKDDSFGVVKDVWRMFREFGWYKGDALEEWFYDVLQTHTETKNGDITLQEIHEHYKTFLLLTMTDVNTGKTVYVTHITNPHMKVKTLVRRSAGIPLFFRAQHEKLPTAISDEDGNIQMKEIEHYFVDGGLMDNYPIRQLYKYLPKEQVIGIKLMSSKELDQMHNPHISKNALPPNSPFEFVMAIITMLRNQVLKQHISRDDWIRTIPVDIGHISSVQFNITDEEKHTLIERGHEGEAHFFNQI